MSLAILPKHTEGRLEFLEDRKGIYGLTWPNPHFGDLPGSSYILRPDRLQDGWTEREGAACLHPLPRNARMFRHTAEHSLRDDLSLHLLKRAGLVNFEAFRDEAMRRRYWGLRNRAATVTNGLIARLIEEAADPEALRIARRYPMAIRMAVYRMAATEPRLRQLCDTFPAAVAVMAIRGMAGVRAAAMQGARLTAIADEAGWPLAFRKVPPGAVMHLLAVEEFLRDRPELIHSYMPKTLPGARRWLAAIYWASRLGGPYVEWAARNATAMGATLIEVQTLVSDLGDWVRASYAAEARGLPEHVLRAAGVVIRPWQNGENLLSRPFHPDMSLQTVIRLSAEWHEAVATASPSGRDIAFPDPWHPGGQADGLEILPIRTAAELWQEGRAMRHCAATWRHRILEGEAYLYSVRRDGERVATAELQRHGDKARLGQVRGPCNARPEKAVEAALRKWLRKQPDPTFPPPRVLVAVTDLDEAFPF